MVAAVSNDVGVSRKSVSAPQADKGLADKFHQAIDKAKQGATAVASAATSAISSLKPSTSNKTGSSSSGGDSASQAGQTITDPKSQIKRLNSDGDQVVMTLTAEGKLQLPIPVGGVPIGIGGKGQYGFGITVKQVGDAPKPGSPGAQPQYDVTFDKNLLAGATLEPPVPGADPAVELSARTAGSVTMRFNSQDEAARAVTTLQRLAASEAVRDAGNAASPLPILSGSNPFSNPVTDTGSGLPTPGNIAANFIKPSTQDMNFLRDHMVSYTERLGVQERGKIAIKFANLGIEPRLDNNTWISRTVELPRNGQPGRLTYTLSGDLTLSTKEKLTLGAQEFDQLEIGYVPQNIVDHGQFRGEVSLSWHLPANSSTSNGGGNTGSASGIPELSGLGAPDRLSAKLQLDYQTQPLTDLSRADIQRLSLGMTVKNPDQHAGSAVNSLLHGDIKSAFSGLGNDLTVTAQNDTIRRDGVHQQHEIGIEVADVAEAKVSLEGNIGLDDVTARRTRTFTGTDIANRLGGPQPTQGPQPTGDAPLTPTKPDQVVVVPHDGLNVRETPSVTGHKISAFQNGTFLQPTDQSATDRKGNHWIEVTGLDANDKHLQGWVNAAYVGPHKVGAMSDTGRINPDLEKQGYQTRTVKPGDTIWDVAHREGVNFQDMVKLNSAHLIDPNLIFPGDTLYIPGTGHPVLQQPAPQPVRPAQPQPSQSGSPSGSGSPARRVPATRARPALVIPAHPAQAAQAHQVPVTQVRCGSGNPSTSSSGRPAEHFQRYACKSTAYAGSRTAGPQSSAADLSDARRSRRHGRLEAGRSIRLVH